MKTRFFSALLLILSTVITVSAGTPELRIQRGHSEQINGLRYDPSGQFAVSCSNDKSIKIWDIKSGKELRTLTGHSQAVTCIDISKDGRKLASGGNRKEKNVIIWDIETGEKIKEITGFIGEITDISFNKTADRIAVIENTGTFETRVSVWNVSSGTLEFVLKKRKALEAKSVDFDPAGNDIALGTENIKRERTKNIFIYDGLSGKRKLKLKGTPISVAHIEYSFDGTHILALGHSLQIWNTRSWTIIKSVDRAGLVGAYSPTGKYVVIGQNKNLLVWDLVNDVPFHETPVNSDAISATIFDPDQQYIMTGDKSGNIQLWDLKSMEQIPHFQGREADVIKNISIEDGKLYTAVNGEKLQYWDLASAKLKYLKTQPVTPQKNFEIVSFTLNKNATEAAITNNFDRGVSIWDLKDNKQKYFLKHTAYCKSACFSADGNLVGAGTMDNKVVVWRKNNSEALYKLSGHIGTINSLAFTPDSKYILSASQDKTLKVWDLSSKTAKYTVKFPQYVNSVSVSPDGSKVLAACGNKQDVFRDEPSDLYLFDLNTMGSYDADKSTVTKVLHGHTKSVNAACFSSKATLIASASVDNSVILWDATEGKKINTFSGHQSSVNAISFSSDDKYLFSGGEDGLLKVWDVKSKKCLGSFLSFDNGKDYVIFNDDNYYTCTKSGTRNLHFLVDGKIYLFEQFDLRLNRPDIVIGQLPYTSSRLTQAYNSAYLKRLKKMGFTEQMLGTDYHVPEIKLKNDEQLPYSVTNRFIDLGIEAYDDLYLLDRINIWVNDVPIFGSAGINLRSDNTKNIRKTIQIELSAGKNKIQISVLNQKAAESLKTDKFVYLNVPEVKPDLYIIAIGVSKYKDSQFNLDYAAKDAADVANAFKNSGAKYRNVYIKQMLNEQATVQNVIESKEFLKKSKVDDHVIVFVASHGLLDDKLNYYLAMTDIDFNNPQKKGLLYEELESILDGIPARNKILLIDACHSGETDNDESESQSTESIAYSSPMSSNVKSRGFKRIGGPNIGMTNSFELMKELFADLRRGSGAVVISSAGGKEYALESNQWNNGVFTYSLLEGISSNKADLNADGTITVNEIKEYISTNVQVLTGGKQNPTSRRENLENDFKVW